MDYFYEQFQTKDYSKIEDKLKVLEKILIALIGISVIVFIIPLIIITILMFVFVRVYKSKLIVEYEYELTSYELSVNKIINKSKRKEVMAFNIKDIINIREMHNGFNEKFINASLPDIGIREKIVKVKLGNDVVNIKLALDEKLVDIIKRVNPIAFY